MNIQRKNIIIDYRGSIKELSGIYGPITRPYMERIQTIMELLRGGKRVTEVLADGSKVELNYENYNADNTNGVRPIVKGVTPPVPPEPITPKKAFTPPTVTDVEKVEAPNTEEKKDADTTPSSVSEEQKDVSEVSSEGDSTTTNSTDTGAELPDVKEAGTAPSYSGNKKWKQRK